MGLCQEVTVETNSDMENDSISESHMKAWAHYLDDNALMQSNINILDEKLERLGIVPFQFAPSGGGSYFRLYLVDAYLQILIPCDSDDLIVSKYKIGKRRMWKVYPDGQCSLGSGSRSDILNSDVDSFLEDIEPLDGL